MRFIKTLSIFGILFIVSLRNASLSFREVEKEFGPVHFTFEDRIPDSLKIELGRKLFYDTLLSADHKISCASCHSPYNAFAHTDHKLSHGIGDRIGFRNAPALFNLAWHESYMWDGAIHRPDAQPLAPITDQKEMGNTLEAVLKYLRKSPDYKKQFYRAYKDSSISSSHFLISLKEFQLSLISNQSRYDSMRRGITTFNPQEKKGYQLFLKHCNVCHREPLFSTYEFKNNGLKPDEALKDSGRMRITRKPEDLYTFKIPSLRNLSYTFPYMHDGRFQSLYEVINHYTGGIYPSQTLAGELRKGIHLLPTEKTDLVAFLLTLNDQIFIFNKNHAFPKK